MKIIQIDATTFQQMFLLISDKKINLKKGDFREIMVQKKKIKNTKIVSIRSDADAEYGAVSCNIYSEKIKNKKPTVFYYITQNTLAFIKLNVLLKETKDLWEKTGTIKIETGKIFFQPLMESKMKKGDILEKEGWNKSFLSEAENGIYEVFQFSYFCKEDPKIGIIGGGEGEDRMFVVKKKQRLNRDFMRSQSDLS
jgi:hypothetical protein